MWAHYLPNILNTLINELKWTSLYLNNLYIMFYYYTFAFVIECQSPLCMHQVIQIVKSKNQSISNISKVINGEANLDERNCYQAYQIMFLDDEVLLAVSKAWLC